MILDHMLLVYAKGLYKIWSSLHTLLYCSAWKTRGKYVHVGRW